MRNLLTPIIFHQVALCFAPYRWKMIVWSLLSLVLYLLLESSIQQDTPTFLVWLALAILFTALQILVFAAFIFFFQNIASTKILTPYWKKFYEVVEWFEAILFIMIIPSPTLLFFYAVISVSQ